MSPPREPEFVLQLNRSGARGIFAWGFSRFGLLVTSLLLVALLACTVWAGISYLSGVRRVREYRALLLELDHLREQSPAIAQLELELRALRESQRRMLRLAGIEPALGALGTTVRGGRAGGAQSSAGVLVFWPVEGEILRTFEESHRGVDIAAPPRQAVLSAGWGQVVAAGPDSALGNRVVIAHGDSLQTVYANTELNLVASGDSVYAGQVIALVGSGFEKGESHLHFQVLRNHQAVSPEGLIPLNHR